MAPGERIVIAGNGPLCLQTAAELLDGGANVVAVLEVGVAPDRCEPARSSCRPAGPRRALLADGLALVSRLKPLLHWRRRVTRLLGDDRVRRVEAADLAIDADIVALGYGFSSSSELARSLGCRHHFVPRGNGSMETVTDADGRTSVPEVFAIGDGARFGGAQAAMAAGSIAAAADRARSRVGGPPSRGARAGALARAQRFQKACGACSRRRRSRPRAIDSTRHRLPLRGGECRRDCARR